MIEMLHQLELSHEHAAPDARDDDGSWLDYLSSHPLGEDRLSPLRAAISKGRVTSVPH